MTCNTLVRTERIQRVSDRPGNVSIKVAIASVSVDAGSVFSRLSSKRLEPIFLNENHIRANTHTDRDELQHIIDDAEQEVSAVKRAKQKG